MDIDFFPISDQAKNFPPFPVKKNLPDWFKRCPISVQNTNLSDAAPKTAPSPLPLPTIKQCASVQDYMTSGYALRFPFDLKVFVSVKDGTQNFMCQLPSATGKETFGVHEHTQMPIEIDGLMRPYVKLYSGWSIKTPPSYSCLVYPNFFLFEKRFTVLPAIIDTDLYDDQVGSVGYFNTNVDTEFMIEAGTPFLNVFPFKRDEWSMNIKDEVKKKSKMRIYYDQMFSGAYRKFFHSKKTYN